MTVLGEKETRRREKTEMRGHFFASPRPSIALSSYLQVALIVLVAAFFRFWQIEDIPPGLFGDEAVEGLDALDVLAGLGQVFFPANYGREGLYIWLVAPSLKLFGVTPLALRLPAILIGILTCVVAWWLAREWGRGDTATQGRESAEMRGSSASSPSVSLVSPYLPLLTGLYLATAYWHVHFSRFSQRTILTPLFVGLAAAAFWRGVNLGRTRWFLVAGAGVGFALHSYSVGRFYPVFLALFLFVQAVFLRRSVQPVNAARLNDALLFRHGRDILMMFLVAAAIFAPLGIYFLTHPGSFFQRASVVATYAGGNLSDALALIGRAALANLAQYVLPGAGDQAQFHNLPGRPIFEPLTALMALLGLLIALRHWRQPRFLFLLLWLAVLTAPAALATDRFPTLPRVLGVIPGLYLFPALGLSAVTNFVSLRFRVLLSARLSAFLSVCLLVVALFIPAAVTYRDYFRVWGPSAATFDAFDGDMAAAWTWLARNEPQGHVYLSSDIYRHPTFMLLAERATVQTYFQHRNPSLSWFDARDALPLPPPGHPATYLIGASAPLAAPAAVMLEAASVRDVVRDPAGAPALTVLSLPPGANLALPLDAAGPAVSFSEQLTLLGARWVPFDGGEGVLMLVWRTVGPVPDDWGGYLMEVAVGGQVVAVPFEAFRGPEWVPGGRFISWHRLDLPGQEAALRLRLVRMADGQPLTLPDAPDGWHVIDAR